jgi:tryptophan synthase beta chain
VTEQTKFVLTEDRIPTHWVNLLPDLPGDPLPPLNPGTMEPAGPDDLTPIFPMEIIGQEVSAETEVEIPEPVRDAYSCGARHRSSARTGSSASSIRPRVSTTSTRASHRRARTSQTARSRRRTPTRRPASGASPPRRAPASGARRSRSRAACSGSSASSTWSARATTRSRTAAHDGELGRHVIRSPSDTTEAGRSQAEHPTGSLGIAISRRSRWPRATTARTTRSARC